MKPGYKQTEVGVIPAEWDVPEVGDVCGCIVPGRNKPKLFEGDIPWITTPDLQDGKPVSISRLGLCVSRAEAKSVGSKIVPPGSVLMSCAGELGIVALTENEIVVNQQLHVFLPTVRIDGTFLLNALSYRKDQIAGLGTKTAVPYLNKNSCNSIPVPLPSLPEQRAIATALSDVDGLLGGLDRLIAKKRDLKQAAMQQLLTGQTRLPGFQGEWEVKRLGNIATCFAGGTPPTEVASYYGGEIPWITSGDLNKEYISDVDGRISQAGLANSAAQMVEADTLLIALYGATSGVTAISTIRAAINQAVLAIVPRQDNTTFLYFKLRLLKDWLISTYTQGGQPNLSGDIVKSVELPFPPLPEQTAIASVLTEMDAELAALTQRREKSRALKQAMMQELLTGRTRLVSPEVAHA